MLHIKYESSEPYSFGQFFEGAPYNIILYYVKLVTPGAEQLCRQPLGDGYISYINVNLFTIFNQMVLPISQK